MNIYEKIVALLLFIIPLVLVAYIWMWVGPVGFVQIIIMIITSIILYVTFFIVILMLIAIIVIFMLER